jgi:hypothetical protein
MMKKTATAKKATVSPADLQKALNIQSGVRAGIVIGLPPEEPEGCLVCGIAGEPKLPVKI